VVDWDDGFFFGDEAAADVYYRSVRLARTLRGERRRRGGVDVCTHASKAPEESLLFFPGEAVDLGGLDEVCAAIQVAAPFFRVTWLF
jgi:hypothetical protein